ncbi:etnppl [Symbiodinium pilosum]|uniref:Etnppl protein n=1 Tax=Symbiodinium pilosum TaxID=2952 RepID=A0A812PK96_SYMPI|nr:etnppl [Symbiodinium pilosum]
MGAFLSHDQEPIRTSIGKDEVLQLRKKHFCPAQSVSYANTDPLLIVRGQGSYLYDEEDNAYLDTRNNVCHVGHSHPRVAAAVADQVSKLNTNTRYLHPNLCLLAKRLTETFPAGSGLEVCFFVNSGSEANDLAVRLAFARTRSRNVIVVDHGYHGHTQQTIEISPYKFDHKGGEGARPNIHKVPCPDTFRGLHRGPDAAEQYASTVTEACKAAGSVAAFFVESGMSVGGVILPPRGYLQAAYSAVRQAGGICVADEVQVGFGRFGDFFWAFEEQGVVPDIVTMGKPFGNGMPLAAVVTTKAVSDAFHNGLEYFNTFGGNPVCCAAGLSVLEVIREEKLQDNAAKVGKYICEQIRQLSTKHELIGDVRGRGLFIGIEFVRNPETLEPATAETSEICSRMKSEHKILMSIDGPHDNVLVIKPPMCFSLTDADRMVRAMREILSTLVGPVAGQHVAHTPT